jgi:hypothetical protein
MSQYIYIYIYIYIYLKLDLVAFTIRRRQQRHTECEVTNALILMSARLVKLKRTEKSSQSKK